MAPFSSYSCCQTQNGQTCSSRHPGESATMNLWLCLLLATAGCCCKAALLLTIPAVLEDLDADLARCVLTTLAPSRRPQGQRLLVVCNAHWCDGRFLSRLGVQQVVITGEDLSMWTESRGLQLMPSNVSMLLVATDSLDQLSKVRPLMAEVMPKTRTLLWTSTRATVNQAKLGAVIKSVFNLTSTVPHDFVRLGVDTAKSTRLFAWKWGVRDGWSLVHVDTWAPRTGRWSRGAPLFPQPCTSWRPPPRGESLNFLFHLPRSTDAVITKMRSTLQNVVFDYLRQSAGLNFKPLAVKLHESYHGGNCRADLLSFVTILESRMLEMVEPSTWNTESLVVVLPAGAGRGRSPLHRLVVFSVSLWCATGAAVLVVVAVLCALRLRGLTRAALQAVAPLMAQPLPFAFHQYQRPLLASWLAVSVVLAAAYQGQVLSRLTVPDAADEINSMEELAASGLTVYLRRDFSQLVLPLLKNATLHNKDLLKFAVDALLERRERVAIIVPHFMAKYLRQHTRGPGRLLHMFPVPGVRILRSLFSTVKGSPVQRPLKTLMGRLHAGGIVDLLQKVMIPRESQYAAPADPLRALALTDVVPPFLALAAGLSLAMVVFLCELARPRLA